MSNLEHFTVEENFFMTGVLPTEIGSWTRVRSLELLRAGEDVFPGGLGGSVPSELGLLTSMTQLELVSSFLNELSNFLGC